MVMTETSAAHVVCEQCSDLAVARKCCQEKLTASCPSNQVLMYSAVLSAHNLQVAVVIARAVASNIAWTCHVMVGHVKCHE